MDYKFERSRSDKISREKILEELEKVAKQNGYTEFSADQFNKNADISSGTVKNEFGSWNNALTALREGLKKSNLVLKPRISRSNLVKITNEELFDEMERIWKQVGHRPSYSEWERSNPKITKGVYRYRFNGWANACLKFIEYKMGSPIIISDSHADKTIEIATQTKTEETIKIYRGKNIPANVRVRVLDRDSFRCVFCGRSPATEIGLKLHIDHKIPFSKGGKTTIDNLQTLCQECNLGKSDSTLGSR